MTIHVDGLKIAGQQAVVKVNLEILQGEFGELREDLARLADG